MIPLVSLSACAVFFLSLCMCFVSTNVSLTLSLSLSFHVQSFHLSLSVHELLFKKSPLSLSHPLSLSDHVLGFHLSHSLGAWAVFLPPPPLSLSLSMQVHYQYVCCDSTNLTILLLHILCLWQNSFCCVVSSVSTTSVLFIQCNVSVSTTSLNMCCAPTFLLMAQCVWCKCSSQF